MSTSGALLQGAARSVAAVASVASLVVVGYGWKNVHDLNAGTQVIPGIKHLGQAPDPLASTGAELPPPTIKGKAQNILVVGNDDRNDMTDAEVRELHTGRSGGSINTDTMMVIHVPADGSKATIISLPRDAYVDIPGHPNSRLNAAYPDGYYYDAAANATERERIAAGASVLIKTVSNLTGLTINHFVQVDLIGFYRISIAIGPITANLCHATSDPSGSHFSAPAGPVTLVGVRALEFVRQRDNLHGGDLARAARQRYFLAAAFRKIASLGFLTNPGKLHDLIEAVDKSLYTDGLSIAHFAAQLADLDPDNIIGKQIPTDGGETVDLGGQQADVLIVDPAEVRSFVADQINGTPQKGKPGKSHVKTKPIDKGCIN